MPYTKAIATLEEMQAIEERAFAEIDACFKRMHLCVQNVKAINGGEPCNVQNAERRVSTPDTPTGGVAQDATIP